MITAINFVKLCFHTFFLKLSIPGKTFLKVNCSSSDEHVVYT